ncbi:TIGR00282 family metallophosphoesterase [Borreliella burgdorferi]|uniref:TIGR00282 family metallophosphoesterase n=1 Tax=Borreliella burgdorferi TaxID=139 RepID=UPI0026F43AD6|nr:TIGR00282 family metallophosphoesterase [Borreliella burgdorferi]MDO7256612.1 TIGR00282 family metallophosphoesterase [Borreliella burgdorferi]MDO7278699.1 TIGR00282 family metallophosphoesterase [Borreliella burgdorferi]
MQDSTIKTLIIGDIIGESGLKKVFFNLKNIKNKYRIDLVIANGENSSNGFGITPEIANNLFRSGVNVITTGNHVYSNRKINDYLNKQTYILRPNNFSDLLDGHGYCFLTIRDEKVAVVNVQGVLNMNFIVKNPFDNTKKLVNMLSNKAKTIFVDFHAESNYEKESFGYFLNGFVTGVVGTHTHVMTQDERILSKGTAYISDIGMTGGLNSVIGFNPDISLKGLLEYTPLRAEVVEDDTILQGVIITSNLKTGRALKIERIQK